MAAGGGGHVRRSRRASPTSASSSTTTSRSTRRRSCSARRSRRRDAAAGALAQPRPRLALRRRPAGSRVGQVLRGRRHAPQGRQDGRRRTASRPRPASTCRAAPAPRAAEAQGDHPRPAQRREPRRRADPRRDDPLPQPRGRQPAGGGARRRSASRRRASSSRKHYQWMVRTDYLPRICAAERRSTTSSTHGRKVFEVGATPTDVPTMPIEFSVAAFRLGHSMVRAAYNWNKIFDDGSGTLDFLFMFSGTSGDLGGEHAAAEQLDRRLPPALRLQRGRPRRPRPCRPRKFNRAKAIDTHARRPARQPAAGLVRRLRRCPSTTRAQPRVPQPARGRGWSSSRPASRWRRS